MRENNDFIKEWFISYCSTSTQHEIKHSGLTLRSVMIQEQLTILHISKECLFRWFILYEGKIVTCFPL